MTRSSMMSAFALLLWAWAMAATGAEQGRLAVEPGAGRRVEFRVWNPTPFATPAGSARVSFLRGGRELHARTQPLAALVPFQSIQVDVPDWKRFSPGVARLCVELRGGRPGRPVCADRTLPGTRPDLRLGRARVDGSRLVVEVRNDGDVASGSIEIRATTRAAGRVVGTTTQTLESLGPRSSREESLQLEQWGGTRDGLAETFASGCCTTEVVLDPHGRIDELDERNNSRTLRHELPRQ